MSHTFLPARYCFLSTNESRNSTVNNNLAYAISHYLSLTLYWWYQVNSLTCKFVYIPIRWHFQLSITNSSTCQFVDIRAWQIRWHRIFGFDKFVDIQFRVWQIRWHDIFGNVQLVDKRGSRRCSGSVSVIIRVSDGGMSIIQLLSAV